MNVVYGITADFALSRLDDAVHPELTAFVEDAESAVLLREILASSNETASLLERIAINPVGPSNVVQMLGKLADGGKLPYRAIAFVDGDTDEGPGIVRLPGQGAPEREVFSALKAINWPNLVNRFGIGAGTLFGHLEDAMLEPDHHEWTRLVGDRVLKSGGSVWETMAHEWARVSLPAEERQRIADEIRRKLEVEQGRGGGRV